MNLEDVKLMYVKYKMNKMAITIPSISEPFEVDKANIYAILIEKEYDNYLFPYFEIDAIVPNWVYRAMKKDNQNLRVYIDLQYGWFKDINYTIKEVPSFSSYVTDNFFIFMEEMTPDALETLIEKKEKADGTFGAGMALGDGTMVRFLLYKEDYLFNSKENINTILTAATLPDAVTFILNKAKINKVLMSPPKNYKTYNEFVLTPISALEQLDRVCNKFGMHTNGTLIFFDFKMLYILDKTAKCTAWVTNEFKTTYLVTCPSTAHGSVMTLGCYSNSAEKYNLLNLNVDTLQFQSLSVVNDQLYGNDFININTNNGKIETMSSGASEAIGTLSTPTRTMVTTEGDDTTGALKQKMKEASSVLSMSFSYASLDMLAPNKEFVFYIDDTKHAKYNGKYRITKKSALLVKEGDFFAPYISAEFRGKP